MGANAKIGIYTPLAICCEIHEEKVMKGFFRAVTIPIFITFFTSSMPVRSEIFVSVNAPYPDPPRVEVYDEHTGTLIDTLSELDGAGVLTFGRSGDLFASAIKGHVTRLGRSTGETLEVYLS